MPVAYIAKNIKLINKINSWIQNLKSKWIRSEQILPMMSLLENSPRLFQPDGGHSPNTHDMFLDGMMYKDDPDLQVGKGHKQVLFIHGNKELGE